MARIIFSHLGFSQTEVVLDVINLFGGRLEKYNNKSVIF